MKTTPSLPVLFTSYLLVLQLRGLLSLQLSSRRTCESFSSTSVKQYCQHDLCIKCAFELGIYRKRMAGKSYASNSNLNSHQIFPKIRILGIHVVCGYLVFQTENVLWKPSVSFSWCAMSNTENNIELLNVLIATISLLNCGSVWHTK